MYIISDLTGDVSKVLFQMLVSEINSAFKMFTSVVTSVVNTDFKVDRTSLAFLRMVDSFRLRILFE